MIDWQQVRQLQTDVGADEMNEVVELFLCEVDEAMEILLSEYPTMMASDRSASFHFLKGCASNLGFKDFGDQCAEGEEITKIGEEPIFQISELLVIYENSKREFSDNYEAELG